MSLHCTPPTGFEPATAVPACLKIEELLPAPPEPIHDRELTGTAILVADESALGLVRYAIGQRMSCAGEPVSTGLLSAPATLIDRALRGRSVTLRDEANAVELSVVVVRHEIGADEAEIILDDGKTPIRFFAAVSAENRCATPTARLRDIGHSAEEVV